MCIHEVAGASWIPPHSSTRVSTPGTVLTGEEGEEDRRCGGVQCALRLAHCYVSVLTGMLTSHLGVKMLSRPCPILQRTGRLSLEDIAQY